MIEFDNIFNINKTTLPLTKNDVESVLSNSIEMGFVYCSYSEIVQTLKMISSATYVVASVNPDEIYNGINNPYTKADVIIKVEGTRTLEEFTTSIIKGNEDNSWSNFTTYSSLFQSSIRELKSQVIQKYLWTRKNIDVWFQSSNVAITADTKERIIGDFEYFKTCVLTTKDFDTFIQCCDEDNKKDAEKVLRANANKVLKKYKHEFTHHLGNISKKAPTIKLKNPIIVQVFVLNQFSAECKKEWPKIKFKSLDKKNFDTLSLY